VEQVKDRVAFVAGATDEIGQVVCRRLASKGAQVVVADADTDKVGILVSEINQNGGRGVGVTIDPLNADQIKKTVAEVVGKMGKIDILVNNFDYCSAKPVGELSNEDWQSCLEKNLSPIFFFTREILPAMKAQKYGRVVNIGSLTYIGWPGQSSYSAAKSALFGLTRSLALESARENVTVNCVAKGDIRHSNMTDETVEQLIKSIPVKKVGFPEDVAKAVGFFVSDESPYVTGQTFFVCGGKSIHFSMSI
jgi:NAD(P)-dependent dehydrogenase (short-subunit alcohol dehydrogenase family)